MFCFAFFEQVRISIFTLKRFLCTSVSSFRPHTSKLKNEDSILRGYSSSKDELPVKFIDSTDVSQIGPMLKTATAEKLLLLSFAGTFKKLLSYKFIYPWKRHLYYFDAYIHHLANLCLIKWLQHRKSQWLSIICLLIAEPNLERPCMCHDL